jgi:hypothetical protein
MVGTDKHLYTSCLIFRPTGIWNDPQFQATSWTMLDLFFCPNCDLAISDGKGTHSLKNMCKYHQVPPKDPSSDHKWSWDDFPCLTSRDEFLFGQRLPPRLIRHRSHHGKPKVRHFFKGNSQTLIYSFPCILAGWGVHASVPGQGCLNHISPVLTCIWPLTLGGLCRCGCSQLCVQAIICRCIARPSQGFALFFVVVSSSRNKCIR